MKRKTLIIALSSIFLLGGCLNNLVPWGKDEEENIDFSESEEDMDLISDSVKKEFEEALNKIKA